MGLPLAQVLLELLSLRPKKKLTHPVQSNLDRQIQDFIFPGRWTFCLAETSQEHLVVDKLRELQQSQIRGQFTLRGTDSST